LSPDTLSTRSIYDEIADQKRPSKLFDFSLEQE